jgi:hypothetical protein
VAELAADGNGEGALTVRAPDGSRRGQLGVVDGVGTLELWGQNGSRNVALSARGTNLNHGSVSLRDADGDELAFVAVILGTDEGHVFVRGPNGNANVAVEAERIVVANSAGGAEAGLSLVGGSGSVFADVKNFAVPHPEQDDLKIVYAAVEGPQPDMFVRGVVELADGAASIGLPEHFTVLASPGTLSVQLTPGSAAATGLGFDIIDEGQIDVRELLGGGGDYPVYFLIHALRKGYEDYATVVVSDAAPDAPAQPETGEAVGAPEDIGT